MKMLYILVKELGSIESLTMTDSLAELLWRGELTLVAVDSRDMRVRNLPFSCEVYETDLASYRKLSELSVSYEKMDKAIAYYQKRYSTKLVNYIIGDMNEIFQSLQATSFGHDVQVVGAIEAVPNLILQRLKHYFVDKFLIKEVHLSTSQHANIKYIDDTADFRIVFTVLDVALPDEKGFYQRQPLVCDIFGQYKGGYYFDFAQIKTDKDRYFGYDEQLYDNKKSYLELVLSLCQDKDGNSLKNCLEKVAKEFINGFDFYLE